MIRAQRVIPTEWEAICDGAEECTAGAISRVSDLTITNSFVLWIVGEGWFVSADGYTYCPYHVKELGGIESFMDPHIRDASPGFTPHPVLLKIWGRI